MHEGRYIMPNNINICVKGKVTQKKGVQICNSDVCIKKSFYVLAWLGNEVRFSAVVGCSERAMSVFSVLGD